MPISLLKKIKNTEILLEILKYTKTDFFYCLIKRNKLKQLKLLNFVFKKTIVNDLKLPVIKNTEKFDYIEFYKNFLLTIKSVKSAVKELDLLTNQSDMTQLKLINKKLIISSDDGTVKALDLLKENARKFMIYEKHLGGIWALDSNGEFVVTGSTDKTFRILKITDEGFNEISIRKEHSSTVRVVKLLNRKDIFAVSGSRDNSIVLFDSLGFPLKKLLGHFNSVRTIDTNEDFLVSGSYDKTVKLWSLSTFNLIKDIHIHQSRVYVVKISNKWIISGGLQGEIQFSLIKKKIPTILTFSDCNLIPWLEILNDSFISVSVNGIVIKYNLINNCIEYKRITNLVVKSVKIHKGLILLGTTLGCLILNIMNGEELIRINEGLQVTKVDYFDDQIAIGYVDESGNYKISVYKI